MDELVRKIEVEEVNGLVSDCAYKCEGVCS